MVRNALVAVLAVLALTHGSSPKQDASSPKVDASSRKDPRDVAFVVALRTFESKSAALADQAAAQSSSPAVRTAAAGLALHANRVAARLWALLDQWHVPGTDRLPQQGTGPSSGIQPSNPTAGLRHACGLVAADELGRLAAKTGTAFDQYFMRAWIEHAQSALVALGAAPRLPAASTAYRLLHQDIAALAAAI